MQTWKPQTVVESCGTLVLQLSPGVFVKGSWSLLQNESQDTNANIMKTLN